jgi:hypothetical protein
MVQTFGEGVAFAPRNQFFRDVVTDDQNAENRAVGFVDGTVTVGPVDVLEGAVADDWHTDVLLQDGFAAGQNSGPLLRE